MLQPSLRRNMEPYALHLSSLKMRLPHAKCKFSLMHVVFSGAWLRCIHVLTRYAAVSIWIQSCQLAHIVSCKWRRCFVNVRYSAWQICVCWHSDSRSQGKCKDKRRRDARLTHKYVKRRNGVDGHETVPCLVSIGCQPGLSLHFSLVPASKVGIC